MSWFASYVRSSVGAKQLMAISGLALLGFALFHMIGHWGMFAGQNSYNAYADFLQNLGGLKWLARGGLLAVFIAHVATGIQLAMANRAARPVPYEMYKSTASTPSSRSMRLTGLAILAFVVYHLVHFTFGQIQPEYFHIRDELGRYDAYSMFVRGFQNPAIFASYLVAVALFSTHLAHGASSWLQTLGLRHPKYDGVFGKLGPAISAVLLLGYMAPPVAILLGVIKLPGA